jgi:hypothetical protein
VRRGAAIWTGAGNTRDLPKLRTRKADDDAKDSGGTKSAAKK